MGKSNLVLMLVVVLCAAMAAQAQDTFGTGANQFAIDFVTISGDASSRNGTKICQYSPIDAGYRTFVDPDGNYRMGVYEVTNDQWDKFQASLGVPVTGDPLDAYNEAAYYPGTNKPTTSVSWWEAAQFVNYLNTSTGHHVAYNFTGTQGAGDYAPSTWDATEADNGTNLYRHADAFYYLPTEDEWVKAAYWNGTGLQTFATRPGDLLHQGDGVSGTGWNFYDDGTEWATDPPGPWDVGSGSEEPNGTYDMMGNVWEWTESPFTDTSYGTGSDRGVRGGSAANISPRLAISYRYDTFPNREHQFIGFRVASVPEPATLSLLALGGLAVLKRRKN